MSAEAASEPKRPVDLSPDENGGRIAVVRAGQVSYLPAKRVDIGAQHHGASGSCRYVRRDRAGNFNVAGPGLEDRIFHSADGGHQWSGTPFDLGMERFDLVQHPQRDSKEGWIAAFTILRDDTFLMMLMPSNHRRNDRSFMARSSDHGATWSVEQMDVDVRPYKSVAGGNADMIELADGTVLLTIDTFYYSEEERDGPMPPILKSPYACVLRSTDGGRTWPQKNEVVHFGAEVHLLELPSGKVMAAIRKQRNDRFPGDPADILTAMRATGYDPDYTGFEEPIEAGTAFYKAVYISESTDGGRTWVNERRVSGYEQCSGELTLLDDGQTLVLQYDSRYHDRFAMAGVRARVSHDQGQTWSDEEYVLGEGENYPGAIATSDGGLMTVCPHKNMGPIQAVHWRPLGPDG